MKQVVIQLARLGDLVQTLPLVKALALQGEVDLVCSFDPGHQIRSLFGRVVVTPLDGWAEVAHSAQALLRLMRERFAVEGGNSRFPHYARVYCMNDAPPALALARLLGRGQWRGAGSPCDPYTRWLHALVRGRKQALLPLVEVMQVLASQPVSPERERAHGIGPILVHPGSGDVSRQLPDMFWNKLLRELTRLQQHRSIVLTGSSAEAGRCQHLASGSGSPAVRSLAGTMSLDELQNQLLNASLLIAQDTGVLHLGAWHKTPLLGLYHGSMYSAQTGPWLEGAHLLEVQRECHPCMEGVPDCGSYECQGDLDPAESARVADALLRDTEVLQPKSCRLLRMCSVDRGLMAVPVDMKDQAAILEQQAQRRALYKRGGVDALLDCRPGLLARASLLGAPHSELRLWRGAQPALGFKASWNWLIERDTLEDSGR